MGWGSEREGLSEQERASGHSSATSLPRIARKGLRGVSDDGAGGQTDRRGPTTALAEIDRDSIAVGKRQIDIEHARPWRATSTGSSSPSSWAVRTGSSRMPAIFIHGPLSALPPRAQYPAAAAGGGNRCVHIPLACRKHRRSGSFLTVRKDDEQPTDSTSEHIARLEEPAGAGNPLSTPTHASPAPEQSRAPRPSARAQPRWRG